MQPKIPIFTKETAIQEFKNVFSNSNLNDILFNLCLTCIEQIHGHRQTTLNKNDTNQLISWFLYHHNFNEETQTWDPYDPYARVDRSDIYYDICKWIQ